MRVRWRDVVWMLLPLLLASCGRFVAEPEVGQAPRLEAQGAAEAYAFERAWGTLGSGDGQFDGPRGVAVDPLGNVYVADSGNHRIQKFGSDGTYLTQWGTPGSGDGQFRSPLDVAADRFGNVFVADRFNYRIQKFRSDGGYLAQWPDWGDAGEYWRYEIYGLGVDHDGNVYAADLYANYIHVYDGNGRGLPGHGGYRTNIGNSENPFHPLDVAVDRDGVVYATDGANSRVVKFGTPISQWGAIGGEEGEFRFPTGIAIDDAGKVYVTDAGNDRVQAFTTDGVFLGQWGAEGSGPGQFIAPRGVAVDSDGNVYVADTGNHRIQKFRPATPTLYLSSSTGGNVGFPFQDEDILAFHPATRSWSLFFDGSRVGLAATDVDAFHLDDDGSLLLSFEQPTNVPGLGPVDDADVVRFTPATPGDYARGTFRMFLDGSDVGLVVFRPVRDAAGVRLARRSYDIDALGFTADGDLVVSLGGPFWLFHRNGGPFASGGILRGTGADLLAFRAERLGRDTRGRWRLHFDGSDVGLSSPSEDVHGLWIDPDSGKLLLAGSGRFRAPGLAGGAAQVVAFAPERLGSDTRGSFAPFWDGGEHGFGGEVVDGVSFGGVRR